MKKWWVAAGCAVVAAVVVYFTVFRASDEDRIREVLNRFAKACAVKKDDTLLSRAGRLRSTFDAVVDDDVHVDVDELGISVVGRKKLVEDATKAGAMYAEATCDLTDLKIKVEEASRTAKVDAVAVVKAGDKSDRRDVHFLLRKDGGWKITTLEVMSPKRE